MQGETVWLLPLSLFPKLSLWNVLRRGPRKQASRSSLGQGKTRLPTGWKEGCPFLESWPKKTKKNWSSHFNIAVSKYVVIFLNIQIFNKTEIVWNLN